MPNKLENYRPTKTHAFWMAAGAAIAVLIIGFGPLGWTTEGAAAKRASDAALDARQQLAAAVCVDHFMKAANAGTRLEKLRNASFYNRADLVAEAGWATMPDREQPSNIVAHMCAAQLAEMKAPAAS